MSGTTITIDISEWPKAHRIELLDMVEKLENQLGNTIPTPIHLPVASEPGPVDLENVESTGWTKDAYVKAMTKLLSNHFVQASVINEAIKNGTGYVSREKVYELGEYAPSRALKGFTRPVNRVVAELVDAGELPEDAEDLLRPHYDETVKSFQRAKGFFVPLELLKLEKEWTALAAKNLAAKKKADKAS